MKFLDYPSGKSLNRGYWIFKENKVIEFYKVGENKYEGVCLGSNQEEYGVSIDLEHPTRSTCTCPFASGKRIVCKHKVALFFTAFPKEADKYYDDLLLAVADEEKENERLLNQVKKYIYSLKKPELQELAYLLATFDDDRFYDFVNHVLPDEYL